MHKTNERRKEEIKEVHALSGRARVLVNRSGIVRVDSLLALKSDFTHSIFPFFSFFFFLFVQLF